MSSRLLIAGLTLGLMLCAPIHAQEAAGESPAAAPASPAEPEAAAAPADAAPAEVAATQPEAEGDGGLGGGDMFGDLPFEKMQGSTIQYENDVLRLIGSALIDSKDLAVKSETIEANMTTKLMTAKGNPVQLRMGESRATCRNLSYDMDKKTAVLEGNPQILSKKGSMKGDVIKLFTDAKGGVSFTITSKDSPAEITANQGDAEKKKPNGAAKPQAEKIGPKNAELLKTPEPATF